MKSFHQSEGAALLLAFLIAGTSALAGTPEGSFGAGGGVATGSAYRMVGSIGSITAEEASSGPYRGHGHIPGIAPAVKNIAIHASPMAINQGTSSQLSATATLDDDSIIPLNGGELTWETPVYPIQTVNGAGLLTAVGNVYSIAPALVRGSYQELTGELLLEVRGPYAGSGIPDDWFVRYFGPAPNPAAAPDSDPTACGQTNRFKYIAGLDPTSATSVFRLRIEPVAGYPQRKCLVFGPRYPNRTYTVQFHTNMANPKDWTDLVNGTTDDNGDERKVTDLDTNTPMRFYRVSISYP